MGHEQDRAAPLLGQAMQRFHDLPAGGPVDGIGGLVHEDQARFHHEGAGDGDALALSSAELRAGPSPGPLRPPLVPVKPASGQQHGLRHDQPVQEAVGAAGRLQDGLSIRFGALRAIHVARCPPVTGTGVGGEKTLLTAREVASVVGI